MDKKIKDKSKIPWNKGKCKLSKIHGRQQKQVNSSFIKTICAPLSFLLFLFFIYFLKLLFFLLYNIVLDLPYINMHPPWGYTCSPSWTPLPPPSPYHPSGSSQCTSPKLPVSCIKPGPVIRFLYDIIHVLMPFSQITPHLLKFLSYLSF